MTDSARGEEQIPDLLETASTEAQSGQKTAKRAVEILLSKRIGFINPTATQRKNLVVEFARAGAVVYGKAFDVVRLDANVDLDVAADIKANINDIVLYEVKSTKRDMAEDFSGHFFSMSTAELLVAQSLGARFRFAFVNTNSGEYLDLSLTDVFAKAKSIYPSWSIRF